MRRPLSWWLFDSEILGVLLPVDGFNLTNDINLILRSTVSIGTQSPRQKWPLIISRLCPRRTGAWYPAPHPPTYSPPTSSASLILHNRNLLLLAIHQELRSYRSIQSQNSSGSKPERRCQAEPSTTLTTFGANPAIKAIWRIGGPGERIGEKGCAVEEIAKECRNEEGRGETGSRAPMKVLVELGEAGAEVQYSRCP